MKTIINTEYNLINMSKKVHVFNAGPCLLPQVAIDNAIEALKDFSGTGISLISISHRTKEWDAVMDETRALWKELLNIPDTHEVVFLGGEGAGKYTLTAATPNGFTAICNRQEHLNRKLQ